MLDFGAFFAIYQQDPLVFLRMCKGVFDCLICVKKDSLRLFYYSNRGNQSSTLLFSTTFVSLHTTYCVFPVLVPHYEPTFSFVVWI